MGPSEVIACGLLGTEGLGSRSESGRLMPVVAGRPLTPLAREHLNRTPPCTVPWLRAMTVLLRTQA